MIIRGALSSRHSIVVLRSFKDMPKVGFEIKTAPFTATNVTRPAFSGVAHHQVAHPYGSHITISWQRIRQALTIESSTTKPPKKIARVLLKF